jgi:hypothetical protein
MPHRVHELSAHLSQAIARWRKPISFDVELNGTILIRYSRDDDQVALERLAALDSRRLPKGPVLARRGRWRACRRGAARSRRRASERPLLAHRQPPRVAETPGTSNSAEPRRTRSGPLERGSHCPRHSVSSAPFAAPSSLSSLTSPGLRRAASRLVLLPRPRRLRCDRLHRPECQSRLRIGRSSPSSSPPKSDPRATSAQEIALQAGSMRGLVAGGLLTEVARWALFAAAALLVPLLARSAALAERPSSRLLFSARVTTRENALAFESVDGHG